MCSPTGNADVMGEIRENSHFSYSNLVTLFRQTGVPAVRMLVGCALAAFAYNSRTNQSDIQAAAAETASGRSATGSEVSMTSRRALGFNDFSHSLSSDSDATIRCCAAFQVAF